MYLFINTCHRFFFLIYLSELHFLLVLRDSRNDFCNQFIIHSLFNSNIICSLFISLLKSPGKFLVYLHRIYLPERLKQLNLILLLVQMYQNLLLIFNQLLFHNLINIIQLSHYRENVDIVEENTGSSLQYIFLISPIIEWIIKTFSLNIELIPLFPCCFLNSKICLLCHQRLFLVEKSEQLLRRQVH